MRVPRRRLRERTFLSGCINDPGLAAQLRNIAEQSQLLMQRFVQLSAERGKARTASPSILAPASASF